MVSASLLTWREGLEAALLVGIVLGYLRQSEQRELSRVVGAGVGAAVGLSALLALALHSIGASLTGAYEPAFEGITMWLAAAVLTWMIFWMRRRAATIQRELREQMGRVTRPGERWGLFGLTFLVVFREGVETALFLVANVFAAGAGDTLLGALFGLVCAVAVGVLIYHSAIRLNVHVFFNLTGVLLMIFAAGLVMHGVHEFQEIGWLPFTQIAWDTRWLLDHRSPLGTILRTLVGYTAQPTWLEIAAYLGYWLVVWQVTHRAARFQRAEKLSA